MSASRYDSPAVGGSSVQPAPSARSWPAAVALAMGALLIASCDGLSVGTGCESSDVVVTVISTVRVGQSVQAAADYSLSNCPASTSVVWTSNNTAVATVNANGLVTGVTAGGPVSIQAKVVNKSGTASITVTP